MKKSILLMVVMAFTLLLVSCQAPSFEIALVTDHGPVTDKAFNQGSWEGVVEYAKEHNIAHQYFVPAENSGAARLDAIEQAVNGGAKVIVTPGSSFADPIAQAQVKYPEIKFIVLDTEPKLQNADKASVAENTVAIYYAEQESGFLAGYAAVKNGFTKLGYFGGIPVPSVTRFGMGYIEGAEYAANELNVDIEVKYAYLGSFDQKPENKTKASGWYTSGTEVIFSAAGQVINNVTQAASETGGKWVIGANVNQQYIDETMLTSALKLLEKSVYTMLEDFYNDTFKGGETLVLDAKAGFVGITQDYSRFETFTEAMYNEIYAKVANGEIEIKGSYPEGVNYQAGLTFKFGEKTTVIFG